ncbi:unnamed protein product [Dovyalis caffra]|uniref:Uncharacterized protein n=1 Tax=Dovyalis caffra TaxID=77055 RepID=A0AAV1SGC2_9ROSI|nr:unnamed protein product [Dovyalis caffra]
MERSDCWNDEEVRVMEWVDRVRKWMVRMSEESGRGAREESGEEKGPLCEGWLGRKKVVRLEKRKVMTNRCLSFEEKEKVSVKSEG